MVYRNEDTNFTWVEG